MSKHDQPPSPIDLAAQLRGTAKAPGILSGSPVVVASRNLLRGAADEIERLLEDNAMWQRAYTEATVRYRALLNKDAS